MRAADPAVTALAPLLFLLVAGGGCGPSIDPAAKADLDRQLMAIQPSARAFPSPQSFLPMAFAAGQWTLHRTFDERGTPGLLTYKLLGEENGAYRIEIVTRQPSGRQVTSMLVALRSGRDPAGMEVLAVKTKDGKGRVAELDPALLAVMQSTFREGLSVLAMTWEGLPRQDVTVAAGSFAGCYKARTDAAWGPWRATSLAWSHPAVPLSGLVRSQRLDKPGTMELVGFGESGAESEL